jgi:hypothetical protein
VRKVTSTVVGLTIALTLVLSMSNGAPAACSPGDRIDGTTVAYATEKIEAAGYQQVHGLKKGCDNYWHGIAKKDGVDVNVVLTPNGKVMVEEG